MYILYSTCTVTGSQLDIPTPPKNESQVSFCCEQFSGEKKLKSMPNINQKDKWSIRNY